MARSVRVGVSCGCQPVAPGSCRRAVKPDPVNAALMIVRCYAVSSGQSLHIFDPPRSRSINTRLNPEAVTTLLIFCLLACAVRAGFQQLAGRSPAAIGRDPVPWRALPHQAGQAHPVARRVNPHASWEQAARNYARWQHAPCSECLDGGSYSGAALRRPAGAAGGGDCLEHRRRRGPSGPKSGSRRPACHASRSKARQSSDTGQSRFRSA